MTKQRYWPINALLTLTLTLVDSVPVGALGLRLCVGGDLLYESHSLPSMSSTHSAELHEGGQEVSVRVRKVMPIGVQAVRGCRHSR